MALTAHERETIIGFSDGEPTASIWTAQRRIITKLKRNPGATLVEEGVHEGTAWARFTLPAKLVSFRAPRAKRELSAEQRDSLAARLRESLASRNAEATPREIEAGLNDDSVSLNDYLVKLGVRKG